MTTTDTRVLVDTNVLIYSIDPANADKQGVAIAIREELLADRRVTITVQVLGEFFRVSTSGRRIRQPLSPAEALHRMNEFARAMNVLESGAKHVIEAGRLAGPSSMAFWDAVILATAKDNGVLTILTEDYDDGRNIEGVRIVNPFTPSFDMAILR